ncbi:MAG: hypothetical protein OXD42_06250 [Rhodospirillaceae bacterium]|nr:hypothetical protein [Rhodospirillaceae bacterium]
MADHALTAASPLAGYARTIGDVLLTEVGDYNLCSVAAPLGEDGALGKALVDSFDVPRPATGQSSISTDGATRLLGLQPDQILILFRADDPDRAADQVAAAMKTAAYVTDQSDSWVLLALEGADVCPVLERLCMLDLDDAAFPAGAVSRTVMEHLSVIILRERDNRFLLFNPRSSARSFLPAVETAAETVLLQSNEPVSVRHRRGTS